MISQHDRHRIQSEAYEKLLRFVDSKKILQDEEFAYIVSETSKKLEDLRFKPDDLLHVLNRTRWRRLQRTQFVYWPVRGGHPRYERDGKQHIIQAHKSQYKFRITQNIVSHLSCEEQLLFDTDDEATVFWRGWRIYEDLTEPDSVIIECEFCIVHKWDGELHAELRRAPTIADERWADVRASLHRAIDDQHQRSKGEQMIQELKQHQFGPEWTDQLPIINLNAHRFHETKGWIPREEYLALQINPDAAASLTKSKD